MACLGFPGKLTTGLDSRFISGCCYIELCCGGSGWCGFGSVVCRPGLVVSWLRCRRGHKERPLCTRKCQKSGFSAVQRGSARFSQERLAVLAQLCHCPTCCRNRAESDPSSSPPIVLAAVLRCTTRPSSIVIPGRYRPSWLPRLERRIPCKAFYVTAEASCEHEHEQHCVLGTIRDRHVAVSSLLALR